MKADLEERTLQADATAPVIKQVLCLISTECFLWSSLSTAVGGSDQSNRRCALFVLTAAEQSPSIVNKPLFLNLALNRNFKLFLYKIESFSPPSPASFSLPCLCTDQTSSYYF